MSEKYYITNGCKFVSSITHTDSDNSTDKISFTDILGHAKKFKYTVANTLLNNAISLGEDWTIQKMFSRTNGVNYVITNATKFVGNKGSIIKGFSSAKSFRSSKDAEDYIKNHRELLNTLKTPIIIDEDFKEVKQSVGRKFTDSQLINMGKVPPSLKTERTIIPKEQKSIVYKNSGGRCKICGAPLTFEEATIDHILPLSRGGKNTLNNYDCVCAACNQRKSDNTPEELNQWASTIIVNKISMGDFSAGYPMIRAMVRATIKNVPSIYQLNIN